MEDPIHYPRITRNNIRRRGRVGEKVAFGNISAQETKNWPRKVESRRQRVKEERNLEGEERYYTADQWTIETS
jgi:hypothetical protein